MATSPLMLPFVVIGFAALWIGVVKIIALLGWQRLANYYKVDQLPQAPRHWLSVAYIGFLQYQRVIRASASAEGLGLSVIFPFRVGHPPLLIPWQEIGPVYHKKKWLKSMYRTTIRTGDTTREFEFTDEAFLLALRPWLSMIEVRS